MIYLFNSHVPARPRAWLFGQITVFCLSFALAIVISLRHGGRLLLANQQVALTLFLFAFPVIPFIALLIKFTSSDLMLCRQKRVGL